MTAGVVRDLALGLLLVAAPLVAFLFTDHRIETHRSAAAHAALAERIERTIAADQTRASAALRRFCGDDLALDAWLSARRDGNGAIAEPGLQRNVAVLAASGAFDAVVALDSTADRMRGRVLAAAGAIDAPRAGTYAGALLANASAAASRPFAPDARRSTHGTEVAHGCRTERDGMSITVVALSALSAERLATRWPMPQGTRFVVETRDVLLDAATKQVRSWRSVATFVNAAGEPAITIGLTRSEPSALARHRRALSAAVGVGIVLAILVAVISGMWRRRGLLVLERAVDRVGQGDLDSTLDGPLSRELRPTATALGRMTEELQKAQARLRRAERIAAWRDIARALAHELKNPLSPIQVSIESLRKAHEKKLGAFDEIFEESTVAILEEVERMKRTLGEFTRFARVPPPKPEPIDLREIVEHVVRLHEREDVRLVVEAPESPSVVRADREQITQVLVNLVQNALDAVRSARAEGEGHVVVAVVPGDAQTTLFVRDDGPGVPADRRASIFEPYVTHKPGGTGLGLAIVHRIVAEHGGTIDVGTAPEGGASFEVVLPNAGPTLPADSSLSADAIPLLRRDTPERPM